MLRGNVEFRANLRTVRARYELPKIRGQNEILLVPQIHRIGKYFL